MIAYKEISEIEIKKIQEDYLYAQSSTYQKDKLLDALAESTEQDLNLLGITGIEDQHQPLF